MIGHFCKVKDISLFEGDVVKFDSFTLVFDGLLGQDMVVFKVLGEDQYTAYGINSEVYFHGYVKRPLVTKMWEEYRIDITDKRGVFWNLPEEEN